MNLNDLVFKQQLAAVRALSQSRSSEGNRFDVIVTIETSVCGNPHHGRDTAQKCWVGGQIIDKQKSNSYN